MKSHLDIRIDGHSLVLPNDFSISIEDQNPIFNETELASYPMRIPIRGNRTVLKNADHIHADMRPIALEHKPMRILADGMPFRSGVAVTQENEELNGYFSLNMDASTQSFNDLIGDLKCRDVPLKDQIQIGEKIGNVHVQATYDYSVYVDYSGKKDASRYIKSGNVVQSTFEPQALGFSYPGICEVEANTKQKAVYKTTKNYPNGHSVIVPQNLNRTNQATFINVTDAYPTKPYCNARVCYKHYGLNEDGTTSSDVIPKDHESSPAEDKWPLWVLDADRQQSGICFYVLYFLDCLFAHLGVTFDNSALLAIEDMKHLCFFTTHCKYSTTVAHGPMDPRSAGYFDNVEQINEWLSSRGCGGKLELEAPETKQINSFVFTNLETGEASTIEVGKDDVSGIEASATITSSSIKANVLAMWATSENFPDATVSSVLSSLENSFGIRFHYDYEKRKVTAYLYRDVFRSQTRPINFVGKIVSMNPVSEKIKGVRVKYSAESDARSQRENVRGNVKDYNTTYDYIDYPEDSTVTNLSFMQIIQQPKTENNRVYIDRATGNTYRWKTSQESLNKGEYDIKLFEVGALKGVEIGDCSPQNEDFIKEFISEFTPVLFSEANYWNLWESVRGEATFEDDEHRASISDINPENEPMLVALVDEEMEHEFVKQKIRYSLPSVVVNIYLAGILELTESYDPTKTDDGNSPLQSYDWGMSIAMMRGGGTNMTLQSYDFNYDGFNNSKWRSVAGKYALTMDSMDQVGNTFDYNGNEDGDGGGERFSLKIRAYKQPSWADGPICDEDIVSSLDPTVIETKIRSRGLFDTFMSEIAHFLLNRKKYIVRARTTTAQLMEIPNNWNRRYRINGIVGYINKVSYDISVNMGLSEVEIEFFAL